MRHTRKALLFSLAFATAISPSLRAAEPEPCAESMQGAFFVSYIAEIARTTSLMRLLNGSENPKLKSVLQVNLLQGIYGAARSAPSGAASLKNLPLGSSLLEGLDRAAAYVADHRLDQSDPSGRTPDDPDISPSEALRQVRAAITAVTKETR